MTVFDDINLSLGNLRFLTTINFFYIVCITVLITLLNSQGPNFNGNYKLGSFVSKIASVVTYLAHYGSLLAPLFLLLNKDVNYQILVVYAVLCFGVGSLLQLNIKTFNYEYNTGFFLSTIIKYGATIYDQDYSYSKVTQIRYMAGDLLWFSGVGCLVAASLKFFGSNSNNIFSLLTNM